MTKKIIIALMVSVSGLQGMICVQTKDMPVLLPQAFIKASPILRNIEKEPEFQRLKLRGLFEDQPSCVVIRVIQDQAESASKKPGENGRLVGYQEIEHIALCICLVRRLQLTDLLPMYVKRTQLPSN